MKLRAVLFDLDETLIDRSASLKAYSRLFADRFGDALAVNDHAALLDAIVRADAGGYRARTEVFDRLHRGLPWSVSPTVSELAMHWQSSFPTTSVLRSGARELLDALSQQGLRLGLITNGSVRAQRAKIEYLGLSPLFRSIVISEAVGIKKPAAGIFALALSELGVEAKHAMYIGDHPVNDVRGSIDAGLHGVWLEGVHAWPSEHAQPKHAVRELLQVLALVDTASA